MKKWIKYRDYLGNGCWHIHTNYTDGENTVDEYCLRARELGYTFIAFVEHVRRNLEYDFSRFKSDVHLAGKRYGMIALVGCEVKVLDKDGSLDAAYETLKNSDIVFAAFHGFEYTNTEEYVESVIKMLSNPIVDAWAHPMKSLPTHICLDDEDLQKIAMKCAKNKVLVESNKKHKVPGERFLMACKKAKCDILTGLDAHSLNELTPFEGKNI